MKAKGIVEISKTDFHNFKYYLIAYVDCIESTLSTFKEYNGYGLLNTIHYYTMIPESFYIYPDNIRWIPIEECLTHPINCVRLAAVEYLIQNKEIE